MSYKNNRLFYRLLQVLYKGAEWRPVAGDQPQVQNGHDTLTTGIAFRYTVKKNNKQIKKQTDKKTPSHVNLCSWDAHRASKHRLYVREDSWDQATRIFKVTSLRSAIRCFFLENKEHVL